MKKDLIHYDLLDNKVIADEAADSGLLDDCIFYQFKKVGKKEPWKTQFSGDLKNDIYLVLVNYDNERLNDAYRKGHLNALITRIIINMVYSNSSNFYRTYMKFMNRSNDIKDYHLEEEE